MFDYSSKKSDKEIASCQGDYIGCEICRNSQRCCELKLAELSKSEDARLRKGGAQASGK